MRERKANRKSGFNYATEAVYFITSCVRNRICYFGNVENNKMVLNQYGKIVEQQILWLSKQYPYFILHNFVVMPNHIHILGEISTNGGFATKIKSIPELMGAFKTTSSKQIHLANLPDFKWQRSYYDHIVRNHQSFLRISDYIDNNPLNWENDTFINKKENINHE